MKNRHWIQGDNICESPLFRRSFCLKELPVSAEIEICGLGYFLLFVNGKRVGDQEFVPAMTNYSSTLGCDTSYPVWEERSAYRCLYVTYDLLPFLKKGENVIGIQLGNGWYHQTQRTAEGSFLFGFPKLRYELSLLHVNGERTFLESDPQTLWKPGELVSNNLFYGEIQDLRLLQKNWCMQGADLSGWRPARPVHAPETQLTPQQCPSDKVLRTVQPLLLEEREGKKLYDCRENIAGWVTVRCTGKAGETVSVKYSEEVSPDRHHLDFQSTGGVKQIQEERYICDGSSQTVHPKFCWHAFRYFEVEGPGMAVSASVVCTDVSVTSSFRCSDPVLNWLYEAYVRTQMNNYHNCIPSDCPHREKLGYTGDGQLTCEAAMLTLSVKELYRKWYQDILDSQGIDSGHIPHTAPFLGGGGGPGGWGGAVCIVPIAFYRIYGDSSLLERGYPSMLRWLEYMNSRCTDGLVTREEEGGWCLGEWCAPESASKTIPAAFVNTYFYIKGLKCLKRIADILHTAPPGWIDERTQTSVSAILRTFYDPETGDFCNGAGAANAFALDLEIGTAKTKENLIRKYRTAKAMDTGIFGTPLLLETLFSEGEADTAFRLLTSDGPVSFKRMMQAGATTLWERWEGTDSHNHPMFGSVVKLLFTEILGIRQQKDSCGFTDYQIAPADIGALRWAEGSIRTAAGTIAVKWTRSSRDHHMILETSLTKEKR